MSWTSNATKLIWIGLSNWFCVCSNVYTKIGYSYRIDRTVIQLIVIIIFSSIFPILSPIFRIVSNRFVVGFAWNWTDVMYHVSCYQRSIFTTLQRVNAIAAFKLIVFNIKLWLMSIFNEHFVYQVLPLVQLPTLVTNTCNCALSSFEGVRHTVVRRFRLYALLTQ